MKKSTAISLAVMLSVIIYAYFFVFQKEQSQIEKNIDEHRLSTSEGLEKIEIKNNESHFTLEFKNNKWWVTDPIKYPANPEFLERSLTVMNQVLADSIFPLEKDKYGFSESQSVMTLSYALGGVKTLVLGRVTGANSQIYILNKESQKVYVVHNVWGQLFYYQSKDLLSPFSSVRSWDISEVELSVKGKREWFVQKNENHWSINRGKKALKIKHSKMLWWLQSIKNMELKPVEFNKDSLPGVWSELRLKATEGEEKLYFNKSANQIYLSSLKAIAEVDSFSLKSIEIELEKVIKSAK